MRYIFFRVYKKFRKKALLKVNSIKLSRILGYFNQNYPQYVYQQTVDTDCSIKSKSCFLPENLIIN